MEQVHLVKLLYVDKMIQIKNEWLKTLSNEYITKKKKR